jgi:RNA polymerase sigma factor (sigma-70 family)
MAAPPFFLDRDARILDLIRKGDEEALVMLYQSNQKVIRGFVTSNSGFPDDAEDMLQEALVILWQRVRSGRFEHVAKLDTFIFATVKNLWLRHLARKRREVRGALNPDDVALDDPSSLERLVENEQSAAIGRALERLGEPCRTLLLLFYWEERSMADIATALGFANADTVKSKKYQCKKALRQMLEHSGTRND